MRTRLTMPRMLLSMLLLSRGLVPSTVHAQAVPTRAAVPTGEFTGRVVDSAGKPIARASIAVRPVGDSSFAGGALPRADGHFKADGIPFGKYSLRVRAIGYAPVTLDHLVLAAAGASVAVGTITLHRAANTLANQVVMAERVETDLAPDRNSYSTKDMAVPGGGSALDVLRNTPAVEVDATNKVSLRGSPNVVVQVNGRASPLRGEQLGQFLQQLPATTVAKIEVATNPSAKSDPEGTAGIINIVLKEEVEVGVSGNVSATAGSSGLASLSSTAARQEGKLTLQGSASGYVDRRKTTGVMGRTYLADNIPSALTSSSAGRLRVNSYTLLTRAEYKLTPRDAIALDAMASRGEYLRAGASDYLDFDQHGLVIGQFTQLTDALSRSRTEDVVLGYRRAVPGSPTSLSVELHATTSHSDADNGLESVVYLSDPSTQDLGLAPTRQAIRGGLPAYVAQADHVTTLATNTKLESGAKLTWRSTDNETESFQADPNGALVAVRDSGRVSAYREGIAAAYAVLSRSVGRLSLQGGLRGERTATRLVLPDALSLEQQARSYGSVFPSAIVGYAPSAAVQLKASYARRIARPHPSMLNPLPYRLDQRTTFTGNPELRPEFTDAYELTVQAMRPWGTIQVNPYLRRTSHAMRTIRFVDSLGVSTSTYANVASAQSAGLDVSAMIRRDALTLILSGGGYRYVSEAGSLGSAYAVHTRAWSTRVNGSWKMTPDVAMQFSTIYRGPVRTEGGATDSYLFTSGNVRKQLWEGKGSVSLGVQDPFALQKFGTRLADGRVIEVGENRVNSRLLTVSVARSFGKEVRLRPRQSDADLAGPSGPPGTP
jgi:ferric enterobactin receptor